MLRTKHFLHIPFCLPTYPQERLPINFVFSATMSHPVLFPLFYSIQYFLFSRTLSKTSSFLTLSVHVMFSILLHIHITNAFCLLDLIFLKPRSPPLHKIQYFIPNIPLAFFFLILNQFQHNRYLRNIILVNAILVKI